MDKDDLWIKKQFLQDSLDVLIQRFEEETKVKIKSINLVELGVTNLTYTRITLKA